MDGCLALVVFAVSLVLLIAPLVSVIVSLQMRSRMRKLEDELRTLRARFDARERRETRDQEAESAAPAFREPLRPPEQPGSEKVPEPEVEAEAPPAPAAFRAELARDEGTAAPPPAPAMEEAPTETVLSSERETEEPPGGIVPPPSPEEAGPPGDETAAAKDSPPAEPVMEPAAAVAPEPPPAPSFSLPPGAPPPSKPSFDWEGLVGVKLFSWIAAVALALAAVFFLKYSIDHGWLSPTIRLLSGLVTGIGLIVLCEAKFAAGYRVTANALDAAGIAILYATLFAAHDLWKLISQPVAFVLMVVVTGVAVFLATRRSSAFIALLGLLGGFATPALLSTGQDRPFSLFGYLLILNAGIAWVAWKKGWPVLSLLSLGFTTLYQWVWVVRFLDGPKVPVAVGVFLVFPIAAVIMIWVAKAKSPERTSGVFEWTAQASALLPLIFAFYGAAVPAFGDRQAWLFFFLLVVDAGLAILALTRRMPGMLHLLGGVSTVLVFAVWLGVSWNAGAWPSVLGWIAAFVVIYAMVPEVASRLGIELDGAGLAARYAAPALLFAFPALVVLEDRASGAGLFFGVLFALALFIGILAVRQDARWMWVPAALFAVAAEGVWAGEHLRSETLQTFLVVCGAFTALFVGLPVVAGRLGKRPGSSRGVALPMLGAIVVLFALADGVATAGMMPAVLMSSVVFVGLHVLAGRNGRRTALVAGTLLVWLLFGALWSEVDLVASLVRAVVGIAAFALVVVLCSVWRQSAGRTESNGDPAIYLGLLVYPFIWGVAGSDDLAGRSGPILALLAFVTLLFAVGSILAKAPAAHMMSAAFTQASLVVWAATVDSTGLTLRALAATIIAATAAYAIWRIATSVGALGLDVHAAAAFASTLVGHVVPIVASMEGSSVNWPVLVATHLILLVFTFAAAWKTGWHAMAILYVVPTSAAYVFWADAAAVDPGAGAQLAFATLLYLPFIAYPLVLGKRAGRETPPYFAAILSSFPYFFFAKDVLDAAGFEFMGMLPIAQAGLMALLLVRLLGIEPEGERAQGRLALVAGTLLAFVTVAIPLQFENEWITIAWALEAAALVWLFRRIPHRGLPGTAAALFAVVFVRLVFNPAIFDYHPRSSTPILNWYLYTYLVPAAAMYVVPYLLDAGEAWKRWLRNGCSVAGTILLFLLVNIEIADFYSKGDSLTFDFDAGLAQDLTYTIAWALFAIAMLVAGIVKERRVVRIASLALLVVAIGKCFLHDLMRLGGLYRVGSLVGLAISLAVVALLLQRFVFRDKPTGHQGDHPERSEGSQPSS